MLKIDHWSSGDSHPFWHQCYCYWRALGSAARTCTHHLSDLSSTLDWVSWQSCSDKINLFNIFVRTIVRSVINPWLQFLPIGSLHSDQIQYLLSICQINCHTCHLSLIEYQLSSSKSEVQESFLFLFLFLVALVILCIFASFSSRPFIIFVICKRSSLTPAVHYLRSSYFPSEANWQDWWRCPPGGGM